MSPEARSAGDYHSRQVEAAHRVLVDLGQVLASFHDVIVVVGGWVPDLLLPKADPEHVGSIDVDVALDAARLEDGLYAELIRLLLATGRYRKGEKAFQLAADVDLGDGESRVVVDIDFLASSELKLQKNRPSLLDDFRVLRFPACAVAFEGPTDLAIEGSMISGASNTVRWRVASLADFVIMKAHAISGRDKPKDVYDLCFCLEQHPGGIESLASELSPRLRNPIVSQAIGILEEKFASVEHFGPRQLAIFHGEVEAGEAAMHTRRAYELVRRLLTLLRT